MQLHPILREGGGVAPFFRRGRGCGLVLQEREGVWLCESLAVLGLSNLGEAN